MPPEHRSLPCHPPNVGMPAACLLIADTDVSAFTRRVVNMCQRSPAIKLALICRSIADAAVSTPTLLAAGSMPISACLLGGRFTTHTKIVTHLTKRGAVPPHDDGSLNPPLKQESTDQGYRKSTENPNRKTRNHKQQQIMDLVYRPDSVT